MNSLRRVIHELHHGPTVNATPATAGDESDAKAMKTVGHPQFFEESIPKVTWICFRLMRLLSTLGLQPVEEGHQGRGDGNSEIFVTFSPTKRQRFFGKVDVFKGDAGFSDSAPSVQADFKLDRRPSGLGLKCMSYLLYVCLWYLGTGGGLYALNPHPRTGIGETVPTFHRVVQEHAEQHQFASCNVVTGLSVFERWLGSGSPWNVVLPVFESHLGRIPELVGVQKREDGSPAATVVSEGVRFASTVKLEKGINPTFPGCFGRCISTLSFEQGLFRFDYPSFLQFIRLGPLQAQGIPHHCPLGVFVFAPDYLPSFVQRGHINRCALLCLSASEFWLNIYNFSEILQEETGCKCLQIMKKKLAACLRRPPGNNSIFAGR